MLSISWLKTWCWQILIVITVAVLTIVPMPEKTASIPYFDKACHIIFMGLISTILVRRMMPWKAIVFGIAMSIGIEVAQYFIPWRDCSASDAICGSVGTVVAVFMYKNVDWYRNVLEFRLR
jgi:VanZ family protein